jgi:hypothetical protein
MGLGRIKKYILASDGLDLSDFTDIRKFQIKRLSILMASSVKNSEENK